MSKTHTRSLVVASTLLVTGCTRPPASPSAEQIRAARAQAPQNAQQVLKPILPDVVPVIDVPKAAAGSLAQIGPAAIPALKTALTDGDPQVRRQAARALGQMGPDAEPAVPELTQALSDADAPVRQAAVLALGKIGPAAAPAITALIEALDDDAPADEAAPD